MTILLVRASIARSKLSLFLLLASRSNHNNRNKNVRNFFHFLNRRQEAPAIVTLQAQAFSLSTITMPSPPYKYYQQDSTTLDVSALQTIITETDTKRNEAYETSRKLQAAILKAHYDLETGTTTATTATTATSSATATNSGVDTDTTMFTTTTTTTTTTCADYLDELVSSVAPIPASRIPREANLSSRIEDYVRYKAFAYFLESGKLIPPSQCLYATDEEYLAGACMGLCQDLSRYGMGRATARDVESVTMARDLVREILDYLLQFDFRNGPLRRKYDGTKYALKTLETLLYELSITSTSSSQIMATTTKDGNDEASKGNDYNNNNNDNNNNEITMSSKKQKLQQGDDDNNTSDFLSLIPSPELINVRSRMEHRDELRETLIKKCRDAQKAAKQSIFALHRGDVKRSKNLLTQCEQIIQTELFPIIQQEPPLRQGGSFTGVMEEYAEGKLFLSWLLGNKNNNDSIQQQQQQDFGAGSKAGKTNQLPTTPAGILLQLQELNSALKHKTDKITTTTANSDDNSNDNDNYESIDNASVSSFLFELHVEEYFGGLCDLTGEIGRYAVQRGTARDCNGVKLCLGTCANILMICTTMERLPTGIGKKMDPLRRSVEKLQRMLYEMSLSEASGGRSVDNQDFDNNNNDNSMDVEIGNNN